jgi:anaerobic selenocysteine-containing dehydrogenase
LLVAGGGALTGLLFTPVPWKVMDDVAIWTQNWPWIPQPARAPISISHSSCTLCPNACGLRVRMAAGWAVGLTGMPAHPVSRGALCPLAFGAHQLNWHPSRVRQVMHKGAPSSWDAAEAAFRRATGEGTVLVIDGRGGRAASAVMAAFARAHNGRYVVARGAQERALSAYEAWSGAAPSSLGYDLDNARTVVSFGAAMLDGWGPPGRFTRLWAGRAAGQSDPSLRLVQIEAAPSRTTAGAWRWIQVRPGSEGALAAGLARVLLEDRLVASLGPVPSLSLADAAGRTGLGATDIRELARTIVQRSPVVAVAADDNPSVAALNVILGAVGSNGGVVRRNKAKTAPSLAEDSGPVRAVLVDASVPSEALPKLNAEIFRFAAWQGDEQVDWLLPAPGFLEGLSDVPTAPGAAIETYAIAAPLVAPSPGTRDAAAFLSAIDAASGSVDDIIKARCQEIFQAREGDLRKLETTPLASVESAEALHKELMAGAVWSGKPVEPDGLTCQLREWPAVALAELKSDWTADWTPPVLPPLTAKLFQESTARPAPTKRRAR